MNTLLDLVDDRLKDEGEFFNTGTEGKNFKETNEILICITSRQAEIC